MTTEYSLLKVTNTPRDLMDQVRVHGWSWTSGGAAFGLGLGIISPLIGSVLTAIGWFTGPVWHGFLIQRYGTVLLFLTIPLLMLGGHCLDLMDKQQRDGRKSRSK